MGVMLSAAGSLAWARTALATNLSYDAMMELARSAPAGSEELVFLPYLGGVGAGVWPDVGSAVDATVRVRDRVEPDPAWVDVYQEGHERFTALYPALRTVH